MKEEHLKQCLILAKKALGKTSPNPCVGALIVKNEKIIGEGFHHKAGDPHAEIMAFENCSESPEGADLYCSLEPCCHTNKRTPPCTERIIKEKIKRVFICNNDSNPNVSGNGVKALQGAGIEVQTNLMSEKENELNKVFHKVQKENFPYIHLKFAQTLDGFIATDSLDSKWITDKEARKDAHYLRAIYDGILVGSGTFKADNPKLSLRYGYEDDYQQPKKIILGNHEFLEGYLVLDSTTGEDLKKRLEYALEQGIQSILVEGGAKVLSSFLSKDLWDEMTIYIAPKLLGSGISPFSEIKSKLMKDAKKINITQTSLINGQVKLNINRNT